MAALSTVLFHIWQQYTVHDAAGTHPPLHNPVLKALLSLEVIDFFFLLSAYLLTLSYARTAIDGGSLRPAGSFLYRRAVRILPLYFLAVLVVWSTRNPDLPGDWLDLVEHLTFTHVLDRERIFYTLGPSWSLSLEIVFYLFLVAVGPLAVRACRRLPRRRTRAVACAAGCVLLFTIPVVWIATAHWALGVPETNWPVYFGPPARFGGFAAGMGLAVLTAALGDRGRLNPAAATGCAVLAAAGLFLLSLCSAPGEFTSLFYHPIASLLWLLLLFGTVHIQQPARWQRLLTTRWLTGIGLVSYSLFIWHEPVMLTLYDTGVLPRGQSGFGVALLLVPVAAVPAAVLSYWLVEYPASMLGRLRDRNGKPRDFYPAA